MVMHFEHHFTFNFLLYASQTKKRVLRFKNHQKYTPFRSMGPLYRCDTQQIFARIINSVNGLFIDNNIYLMHLKQGGSEVQLAFKRRQSLGEASSLGQSNQFGSSCTFLDHYACVQEATDILNGEFNKSLIKNKEEEASLVDYIDQFLWNSPPVDDSPILHHPPTQPSSLMQRQKNIYHDQPSPLGLIIQTPKIEPLNLTPVLSKESSSNQLSKDYKKNLAGYIIKKVIRMILSPSFSARLHRLCQRSAVDLSVLQDFLESSLPRVFGPNSIYELFSARCEEERGMKELVMGLVERMLRKRYTLQILREGRMRDYDAYVSVKNRGLLYFSQLLQ